MGMNYKELENFLKKTDKSPFGCWLWIGCVKTSGYGKFTVNFKTCAAHRASYEHFIGEIPDKMEVRHLCHVRNCVNPDHLAIGTAKENYADRVSSGRAGWKLSEEQVQEIRTSTESNTSLGIKYGVDRSHIWRIRHNEHFKTSH